VAMQSVLRSLQVLEAVAYHQPVRVGELTPLLGLPKSTVQRSLETLAEAGWLRQVDGDLTRWALTSRAQAVVLRSAGEVDLRECALAPMQHLRDVTDETTHLFVPTGRYHVVVIERVDSRRDIRTVIPLGTVFPQAGSAAGVAMLAQGSDEHIDQAIAEARETSDPRVGTELDKVRDQAEAARRDGYSCRMGWDRDVMGIGAAIVNHGGEVIAGLSVSIPLSRYQQSKEKAWGSQVTEAAVAVSRSLGFQDG
jgi:IclR family transcriptional regulator, acetate operon repressor